MAHAGAHIAVNCANTEPADDQAVRRVETKTHKMMRVDTLLSGAFGRTLSMISSGDGRFRGGLIGPRAEGFAPDIDRRSRVLECSELKNNRISETYELGERAWRDAGACVWQDSGKPLLLEEKRNTRRLRESGPSDMMRLHFQGVSPFWPVNRPREGLFFEIEYEITVPARTACSPSPFQPISECPIRIEKSPESIFALDRPDCSKAEQKRFDWTFNFAPLPAFETPMTADALGHA